MKFLLYACVFSVVSLFCFQDVESSGGGDVGSSDSRQQSDAEQPADARRPVDPRRPANKEPTDVMQPADDDVYATVYSRLTTEEAVQCNHKTYTSRTGYKLVFYQCASAWKICSRYRPYYLELWHRETFFDAFCATAHDKTGIFLSECIHKTTHVFRINTRSKQDQQVIEYDTSKGSEVAEVTYDKKMSDESKNRIKDCIHKNPSTYVPIAGAIYEATGATWSMSEDWKIKI